jgi:FtsH-binding integral membrane protein
MQLLVTSFFVLATVFNEGYRNWQKKNSWLLFICLVINIATLIALYCFRNVCKKVPRNYIVLFIFTASESYMISYIACFVKPFVVLEATLITALIVFILFVYAFKTKRDITLKVTFFIYAPIALLIIIIIASAFTSYIV